MIDSLAKLLLANDLDPDSFTEAATGEAIFRGEVPAGRVMQIWANLAKASRETKYWPIIRGGPDDIYEQTECDPASILANVPVGSIREILKPRMQERLLSFREMIPELPASAAAAFSNIDDEMDMDQLAAAVDASGIYSFSGREQTGQAWPTELPNPSRVTMQTLKGRKGKPSVLLLIRVDHSYEVPAYLNFGGWNDCPAPELQVAVLREWRSEYQARPACITGDVLECVVINRPQTEAQSMKLAAEQWIFCDDIVGQGTQSVRKLAMEIWRSPNWFFWWD